MKKTLLSSILIFSTAFSTGFSTALPVFAEPTDQETSDQPEVVSNLQKAFSEAENDVVSLDATTYDLSEIDEVYPIKVGDSDTQVATVSSNGLFIFAPYSLQGQTEGGITTNIIGTVNYVLNKTAIKSVWPAGDQNITIDDEEITSVKYSVEGIDFTYGTASNNVLLNFVAQTYIEGTDQNVSETDRYTGNQEISVSNNSFNGGQFAIAIENSIQNANVTISNNTFNTFAGIAFANETTLSNGTKETNSLSVESGNIVNGLYAYQAYQYTFVNGTSYEQQYYSSFDNYPNGTVATTEGQFGFYVTDSEMFTNYSGAISSYSHNNNLILAPSSSAYSWDNIKDVENVYSSKTGIAVISGTPTIATDTSRSYTDLAFTNPITIGESDKSPYSTNGSATISNGTKNVVFTNCYFTNALLTSLEVYTSTNSTNLITDFSSETLTYNVTIPYNSGSAIIKPVTSFSLAVSDNATSNGDGTWSVSPVAGTTVSITITVSDASLETKVYTLNISFASRPNSNPGGTVYPTPTPPETETPDTPEDTPEEDEPGNEPDFEPDSGTNSGVTGEGPGFTEDGSQSITNPETNTTVTYNQNTDGSKTATTQDAEGNVTSAVVTVPESAIQNNQANVSLGTNESGQTLAIPGNKVAEGTAPHITINLPENTTEAKVSVPIESGTLDPGTVAMLVGEDGSLTPIILTTTDSDSSSITIPLTGSQRVVIMDNSLTFQDSSTMPDYAQNAAAFTSARRLMTGMGESSPKPFDFAANTSRGQFATILYRLEGEPAVSGNVPEGIISGAWNANAATWAVDNGLMAQGGSRFNPQDDITRDQIIAIVYRMNGSQSADLSVLDKYSDADLIPNTEFRNAMAWGVQHGIIGQGVDTLNPESDANRAEIAAMIQRIIENLY